MGLLQQASRKLAKRPFGHCLQISKIIKIFTTYLQIVFLVSYMRKLQVKLHHRIDLLIINVDFVIIKSNFESEFCLEGDKYGSKLQEAMEIID